MGLSESRGLAWNEIYFGGLIDTKFPQRLPQNIFLPEATLESLGVRTIERSHLTAAYHFYRLLLSAPKVTLSYSEIEEDRPTVPSPFLEELAPLLASVSDVPVAAALLYRYRGAAGLHFVATRPSARGQGAATSIVAYARRERPLHGGAILSIFADSERLERRLERLGFVAARSFVEYELPRDAHLALPPPGPPGPPRWRPPRGQRS